MNCRSVERLLPLFVGGDLDASRAKDVREHLANCQSCGALQQELTADLTWLAADRPPFAEDDYAALRRGVWREIEARRASGGAFWPGRFALAGGAVLAAALVMVLWLRPRPESPEVAGPAAVAAPTPLSVAAARPRRLGEEPAAPVILPSARVARRRNPELARSRAPAAEDAPVKIEFQTANPNVRIIWLVKKDETSPASPSTRPNEEVS